MLRLIALALFAAFVSFAPAEATAQTDPRFESVQKRSGPFGLMGGRERLGYGRLTTNDMFGDGKDRWRTGSLTTSRVWGYGWDGRAPSRFGDLIELRLQGQIIAPVDLVNVNLADRPWAGALQAGLHTHFMMGEADVSVGGDLVVIGPQTNLDDFQDALHQLVNVRSPSDNVLNNQIGNRIRPTLVVEAGRSYAWSDRFRFRPFAEGRAGDETLVRVGADLTFGVMGLGELMVRESITGHRYRAVKGENEGLSFVLGADIAHVFDSVYLPENRGYQLVETRERVRLGVQYQNQGTGLFYGLTWLGEEFVGQTDDQLVGSLKLDIRW
ncbi:lipid A-modifier LpxR family protein [Aestuariivita boseongensis]|uniref:lipid A-modifier LpxR family protein n=1 Tax=Aestuariivita boseongensis TaxID=1470562 RepID=UPI000683568F|nr:lipid A-modifier LpxR family protein [Aestuariivita boseongensis]